MSSIELKQRTGSMKLKQRSGSMKLKERTGRIEKYTGTLLNGLVAYYPFDGDVKDRSWNGNDGTIHGDPKFVEGVSGQALQFDNSDDSVEIGNLGIVAHATLTFWMYKNFPADDNRIFSTISGGTDLAGSLRYDSEGSNHTKGLQCWDGQSWQTLIELTDIADFDEKWVHIAVIYNEGSATGYLNSNKELSKPSTFDFEFNAAGISAKYNGKYGNSISGELDEFRIYNRALTENEIQKLYERRV